MVRMLAATLIGLILASTVQAHEALQQRYRRLPTKQIAAELDRYCAGGHAPCAYSPPRRLLDEAARRGLIQLEPPAPRQSCIVGLGIISCISQ
jgi:hypothetical protein